MEMSLREEKIQKYMQEMLKNNLYSKFGMEIPFTDIVDIKQHAFNRVQLDEVNEYNSKQRDKILAKRALFKEILIDRLLKQDPYILKEYLNMELIDEMLEYSYKADYEKFLKNIENGEI